MSNLLTLLGWVSKRLEVALCYEGKIAISRRYDEVARIKQVIERLSRQICASETVRPLNGAEAQTL